MRLGHARLGPSSAAQPARDGWPATLSGEAGRAARSEERALNREEELDSRRYPIAEDMALQCRIWRFERIGWWGLGLVVLLALLGLFSRGR